MTQTPAANPAALPRSRVRSSVQIRALVKTWLVLDFFGDSRRAGGDSGSSLTTTIMWQALLSFVFAMLLYPDTPPVPFVAANLCLSTLLIAIGALGDEDRPLRLQADATLLAGAPVARTTVVLARSLHASIQLALVTIGMALPPALLLAHLTDSWLQALLYVVAATACTGLAAGGLATLRTVLARAFGTLRATLLLGTVKAGLLGAGFVLFALSLRQLTGTADDLPIRRFGAELLPPYHAARLLATPHDDAWRIWPWLAVVAGMLLVTVLFATNEANAASRVGRRRTLLSLLGRISGRGPRRGIAEFVALSMWRSPGFRARVLPLFGLPAGMVFLTMSGGEAGDEGGGFPLLCVLLQLPAIYLPFLVAFLPRADQARTGWVFEHAPGLTQELVRDATWRALVTHVLVPIHLLGLLLVVGLGPDRADRAAAALFAFGIAVLTARVQVHLDRVPFTDDREEDRGLELGGLMGGALVLAAMGAGFGGALPEVWRWPVAGAVAAMAIAGLLRQPSGDSGATTPVRMQDQGSAAGTTPQNAAKEYAEATSAASASTQAASPAGKPPAPATLGRELRAVAVLYVVLCVLPLLAGSMFGP
ncbi:MAG: hypothetical protein AB8H80_05155 [Planctomycetota bacterium]